MVTANRAEGAQRVTVRVNGEQVQVRVWALWRDAVTAWRPEAGAALSVGRGILVDARGEPVDPGGAVVPDGGITFRRKDSGR